MPTKLRGKQEVVERCRTLGSRVARGLADDGEPDDIWLGEALGALLWSLGRVPLPRYDTPFDSVALLELSPVGAELRPLAQIEQARQIARLWHWRARTTTVRADPDVQLPERWVSFDQLVAATAVRGHRLGLLPVPLRGDFPAYGRDYRRLDPAQLAEAASIAWERHRAFTWLCTGSEWDAVTTNT